MIARYAVQVTRVVEPGVFDCVINLGFGVTIQKRIRVGAPKPDVSQREAAMRAWIVLCGAKKGWIDVESDQLFNPVNVVDFLVPAKAAPDTCAEEHDGKQWLRMSSYGPYIHDRNYDIEIIKSHLNRKR